MSSNVSTYIFAPNCFHFFILWFQAVEIEQFEALSKSTPNFWSWLEVVPLSPIDQNSVALSQNTDCKWDKLFILHMFQNVALTTYSPPVMSEVSPIKYIFTLYSADSSKTLKGVQSVWIPKETATLNLTDKRTIYLFTQFPQFLLDKWSLDK